MPDSSGELVPGDLATYTRGRLDASDAGTKDALVAAVAAARRFCRWHVTPSRSSEITLDGPGSPLLSIPTQRMTALTSLTEDGVTVDLSTVLWSRAGKIRKKTGGLWSAKYSGIVAEITHGFIPLPDEDQPDEPDAADFNRAVLSYADRLSLATTGGRRIVVGPFQYEAEQQSAGSPFSAREQTLLSLYRLEGRP